MPPCSIRQSRQFLLACTQKVNISVNNIHTYIHTYIYQYIRGILVPPCSIRQSRRSLLACIHQIDILVNDVCVCVCVCVCCRGREAVDQVGDVGLMTEVRNYKALQPPPPPPPPPLLAQRGEMGAGECMDGRGETGTVVVVGGEVGGGAGGGTLRTASPRPRCGYEGLAHETSRRMEGAFSIRVWDLKPGNERTRTRDAAENRF